MVQNKAVFRALGTGALYLSGGALAALQTRFDGGFAFIWASSALLLACLITTPVRSWASGVAACAVASILVTGLFGLGWAAALPLLVANIVEAVGAAWLLRGKSGRGTPMESLEILGRFVVAVAGLPTLAASVIAGVTLHVLTGAPFGHSLIHWYTGHALGFLTFTPVLTLLFSGKAKRQWAAATRGQLGELGLTMTLVAAISALAFSQSWMPLLFAPIMPIILATFRTGRVGAGIAVTVLAVIAAGFTIGGSGPIYLMDASAGARAYFLQFYLACTVLSVLPIAIDLSRRQQLVRALKNSEARYRVLADHSTDIIMNLDANGVIRFASPAVRRLGGYEPDELIGRRSAELIDPAHVDAVRAVHMEALRDKGPGHRVEYLAVLKSGERRWFETHTCAVLNERGDAIGVVSIIRDVAERKALEVRLADAAARDPLTELLNRRGFMRELEQASANGEIACVAMFDIDHFKRVNDGHGHAAGDEALKMFARIARQVVRNGDHVGRMGGEEFALLLKGASIEQAQIVCERLRATVAESACFFERSRIRVTVSGGVASVGGDASAALKAADRALYSAKENGRDRLALAA